MSRHRAPSPRSGRFLGGSLCRRQRNLRHPPEAGRDPAEIMARRPEITLEPPEITANQPRITVFPDRIAVIPG